jgi:Putative DNA-binding domain
VSARPNSFKEEFACFLEEPSRDRLRKVLKTHHGELPNLDFKAEWPDDAKLAKHVLGFANSGGGCLVIGVAEASDKTLTPVGLPALRDKAEVDTALRNFLPTVLAADLQVMDFNYSASEYGALVGRSFQVLFVPDDEEHIPFMAIADASGLSRLAVYVRRLASSEVATYEELQTLINRKIATGRSTQSIINLGKHLTDLKLLYDQLERFRPRDFGIQVLSVVRMPNPEYPPESFDSFIRRMIELKKTQIQDLLS